MKITKTDTVTEISEISGLSCLEGADIGSPALLIVHISGNVGTDESIRNFFLNAPFITAAAGSPSDGSLSGLFDLVITEEEAAELPEKLYKDKSLRQINEINDIFIAARKGASQEELLTMESKAFYRLMAEKNGGGSNE